MPHQGTFTLAVFFFSELVNNYTKLIGCIVHIGFRNRSVKPSSVNQPPFPLWTVSTTDFPIVGRNNKPTAKREHHRSCFQSLGGILQQPFSRGQKERGRETPSNHPFQVLQLCGILPLQDRGPKSSCRPFETREFHVQTRPEGRLFLCPPSQAVSEIHSLSVPRENVPIHLSPIRAGIGPTHLRQNTQTSNRDFKKNGNPDNSLSGRYAHYKQHLREGARKDIMILKSILENL